MNSKFKIIPKVIGFASLLAGGYYLAQNHHRFIYNDNRVEIIKSLLSNSTTLALSNYQIFKNFGPQLTTRIDNDIIENFNNEKNNLSFTMKASSGKPINQADFADINVNAYRSNKGWYVESMDIKFINSSFNVWHKLLEALKLEDLECKSSSVNIENILNSSSLKDSSDYIKVFSKNEPFLLKSLELLLNDKQKMQELGVPLKLISHDVFTREGHYFVQMNIEGQKRNCAMLVEGQKEDNGNSLNKDVWIVNFIYLMYELSEDLCLSSSELALKYSQDLLESMKPNTKFNDFLNQVNLTKLIEDRIINNSRIMNTIGRPFEITVDLNDNLNNNLNEKTAKIKLKIKGKLNKAEFFLNAIRDDKLNWKLSNCDFKILWNTTT